MSKSDKYLNCLLDITAEERDEILKTLLPTPFTQDSLVHPMLREARKKLAAKKQPPIDAPCPLCGK